MPSITGKVLTPALNAAVPPDKPPVAAVKTMCGANLDTPVSTSSRNPEVFGSTSGKAAIVVCKVSIANACCFANPAARTSLSSLFVGCLLWVAVKSDAN
ncbi:MAG: hypothetical protein ACYTE8_00395 [Planctomycetota bacterium]